MFGPITIPYECVMLYNTARLKYNVEFDDVEMAIAEMCSHVKETYEDFIAGQVFHYAGFISEEGTIGGHGSEGKNFHPTGKANYPSNYATHTKRSQLGRMKCNAVYTY